MAYPIAPKKQIQGINSTGFRYTGNGELLVLTFTSGNGIFIFSMGHMVVKFNLYLCLKVVNV